MDDPVVELPVPVPEVVLLVLVEVVVLAAPGRRVLPLKAGAAA